MNKARFGAKQAVEVCAGVKKGDKVVLIKDEKSSDGARYLEEVIDEISIQPKTFQVENFGKRPLKIPPEILKAIKETDVAFICLTFVKEEWVSFWLPIKELVKIKTAVKILTLVDLEKRVLEEGMNADYRKIREFSQKVYEIIKNAKVIKVKTKLGSDFTVQLGYKWVILDGFPEPGKWVNLPDGEILTTPKSVDGRIVIDGVIEEFDRPRFGLLKDYPISLMLKNGYAAKESIGCKNKDLKKFLESNIFGRDRNAFRVGEFAFGTNIYLKKLIGNLTQDEKFPSVHIAFGDPHGEMTGAEWESEIHMDAVVLKPTVWVDKKVIMKEGKYLI